jgi:hypothetical protein
MPGGGGESTTTETKQIDPNVRALQDDLWGAAKKMFGPHFNASEYLREGMNPDILQGVDLFRENAEEAYSTPAWNVTKMPIGLASDVKQVDPASVARDAKSLMNPMTDEVVGRAIDDTRREGANAEAKLVSDYAARQALGGSSEAIALGQLRRGVNKNMGDISANMRAAAFDKALGVASGINQQNASAEMARRAQLDTQNLQRAGVDASMREGAARNLVNNGLMTQQFGQGTMDKPLELLAMLNGMTPKDVGYTATKTQPTQGSGLQQGLGAASSALGIIKMLSDEDEKTNKQKLGKDPNTGDMLYAYDYKADVEAAKKNGTPMPPKRVGPMAQGIEKRSPGSTSRVGGKLVVNNLMDMLVNNNQKAA